MKFGVRKPSLKKSIKARTTGKVKRKVKSSINPLYGKKGMGLVNNPKKSVYNKVYHHTTVGVNPLSKKTAKKASTPQKKAASSQSIGFTKKEHIEKEVPVTNSLEKWFRKLLRKETIDKKTIEKTVIIEQYTYEEMDKVKKEAEDNLTQFKQSVRFASETVNAAVFFSNLSEAEAAISNVAYYTRSYSFLGTNETNVIEIYHHFLDEKEAYVKQFLHRHFQTAIEGASLLKTERGRRNRLEANYTELTDHFPELPEGTKETVNTIWETVIPENKLKES